MAFAKNASPKFLGRFLETDSGPFWEIRRCVGYIPSPSICWNQPLSQNCDFSLGCHNPRAKS